MAKRTEITLEEFGNVFKYMVNNNKRLVDSGETPIALGIEGDAGCGKTSKIESLAAELGMTMVKLNLAELEEIGDLVGFPLKEFKVKELHEDGTSEEKWVPQDLLQIYFNQPCGTYEILGESRMGYATPAWLPREFNPNGTVLLLDDYTRANQLFMQATMELICRGSYVSWDLPKYTNIILSSNPDNGEFSVTGLDMAQRT